MPTYTNAAGLIESYAASGVTVPYGTYLLQRPVALPAGSRLSMAPRCVLRIGHAGLGLEITGNDASIMGGVIDGGVELSDWTDLGNGTWAHAYSSTNLVHELFVGNERRFCGRYPTDAPTTRVSSVTCVSNTVFEFSDAWLAANIPQNPTDVLVNQKYSYRSRHAHALSFSNPSGTMVRVETKAALFVHATAIELWFTNLAESLEDGTWWHDRANSRIVYKPEDGETINGFTAVVPLATQLLYATGVSGVSLTGVMFQHCAAQWPDTDAITVGGLDATYLKSAVIFDAGCSAVTLDWCTIKHVGGSGLIANYSGSGDVSVRHSRICDTGIMWAHCGRESGHWLYGDRLTNLFEDCIFEDCGQVVQQGWGLKLYEAAMSVVRRCRVRRAPYVGVGIAYAFYKTPCGSFIVEDTEFDECMTILDDGGQLYMMGEHEDGEVSGCLFRNVPEISSKSKFSVYYEASCKNTDVHDSIFADTYSSAGMGYVQTIGASGGCLLRDNDVAVPTGGTIDSPPWSGWYPSGTATWYRQNHVYNWQLVLTAVTDNGDGTHTIEFQDRRTLVSPGPYPAYPLFYTQPWGPSRSPDNVGDDALTGCWVYFWMGAEDGNWYQIIDAGWDYLVLDTPAGLSAIVGDDCGFFTVKVSGNTILNSSDLADEVASWLAANPEPAAPTAAFTYGPEMWFDLPENTRMLPLL